MTNMNSGGDAGKVKKTVEKMYQKKSQLEHILLRPDTYIGSVEKVTQSLWVLNQEQKLEMRDVTYVPGLFKIYDEIIVNAADNKQRDKHMNCIKITINPEKNRISVWNNGKGVPVVMHKEQNMMVPTMIFGHLLTSSNFDDTEKKVTGGRNGFGAKLCNVFSNKFSLETVSAEYKKSFTQQWTNNMTKTNDPVMESVSRDVEDFTSITFEPDLSKFGMQCLDEDTVALFTKRAYDIAACVPGIKVFLNGKRIQINNFKTYVDMFIEGRVDDNNEPLKVVSESINKRWEIAITTSDRGFSQVSYVNSINTIKGGRHVDYIADMMVTKIIEVVKKKEKKGGLSIKPFQVKAHMWVFVNCLIENPTFDSQTKETLTLQSKSFGSSCAVSDTFMNKVNKCGIVESITSWMKFKELEKINKKCTNTKSNKIKGVPKLDDANDAGTKKSEDCTLILTEGDSAKTLAVSGLSIIGRDKYGVFPLRGKMLNVREATHKQILENAETNNLIKILGLRYKEKYNDKASLQTLRYGKVMIMTDQDQDGSHIKGLVINFFHYNWPKLLQQDFLEEFITPIIKISKKNETKNFYSLPEFDEWKQETDNWQTYKVKYYKGLGTSTSKEAKEYFADMVRHKIPFKYENHECDESVELAFSKKKVDERKVWLTNFLEDRKQRAIENLPEVYLYGKHVENISYSEFVNKELILFSNMDNERSIPSLVDGFKPGQRKVMFACFKRNVVREAKVAQLAGTIAELSAYHHGEASLMGTIVNLAQDFVGSNNVNLLRPIGQFGTRLHGGKDSASPRYIFTALSHHTRMLYPSLDDAILKYNYDDNLRIEPNYYIPIVPMVLINGAEGIGTGWSTKVPNYDPREVVRNVHNMLNGEEIKPMMPWYKNFKGTIQTIDETRYASFGEAFIVDDNTLVITELPVRTWTQNYKENVLENMITATPALITNYKEYHTDVSVHFVVTMTPDNLRKAEQVGIHKFFKLQALMSINSMVLFDANQCIKRYTSATQIFQEFYEVRMEAYKKRKEYLEGMLGAEALRLTNQARFILEKTEGTIVIENKKKKDMIQILIDKKFDSDPVKKWKEEIQRKQEEIEGVAAAIADKTIHESDEIEEENDDSNKGKDFNYLLGMQLWYLTLEKKEALLKEKELKCLELSRIQALTTKDMWRTDLDTFSAKLDEIEQEEAENLLSMPKRKATKSSKGASGVRSKKAIKADCNHIVQANEGVRVLPLLSTFTAPVVKKEKKPKKEPSETKPKVTKKGVNGKKAQNGADEDIGETDLNGDVDIKVERISDSEPEDEFPTLAQRMKKLQSSKKAKKTEVDKKQPKIGDSFKKAAKTTKKPRKNYSSESDQSEEFQTRPSKSRKIESDSDFAGQISDDSEIATPSKRSQRNTKKSNYVFSDSDEDM